jgi:tetratricopeptide (TPR) repeat protein
MERRIFQTAARATVGGLCLLGAPTLQAQGVSECSIGNAKATPSWEQDCSSAIQSERDPSKRAELHFRRAYVLNEQRAYERALEDLNAACALVPHHAAYLRERGYTLNSLGRYRDALVDLDEDARLEPGKAEVYTERALTRTRLGDWAGALADRDREVQLNPKSASTRVARARARLWLGQFDEARADLKTAAALLKANPGGAEEVEFFEGVSAQLAAWTHHSDGRDPAANCGPAGEGADPAFAEPTLIGDCTLAFLRAKSPQQKAEALTTRAIAWLVARQSQHDATNDYEAAVALEPANPDRHTNLGFGYIQERHSWGARQEFDRSIEIRRTWLALAGRASAHYNLREPELALTDANESMAIRPNELALLILGDLAKDRQQDAEARRFWMGAYALGERDDGLVQRLKSVGVEDPSKEATSP